MVVAVGRRRDVVGRAVEARFGRGCTCSTTASSTCGSRATSTSCASTRATSSDRPLPAGRLREGHRALERADVVLLTRLEAASEDELAALEERLGRARAHRVSRRVLGFRGLDGRPAPRPRRAFVLAAIARPERFERDVLGAGAAVAGRGFFRDHHSFRAAEVEDAVARARAAGADAIVTTAKDAVRLEGLPAAGLPVLVLEVAAEIADEARFRERLLRGSAEAGLKLKRETRHALEAALAAAVSAVVRRLPRPSCSGWAAASAGSGRDSTRATWRSRPTTCGAPSRSGTRRAWCARRAASTPTSAPCCSTSCGCRDARRRSCSRSPTSTGVEHLQRARAAGRGVIAPSSHIGNWEFNAVASVPLVGDVHSIARPLDNPALDRRLVALRTSTGNKVIYKQRALSQAIRAIREGGILAVLIDQNVQEKDGIFVRFFGRPGCTTTVAAALALKTGCAIVPGALHAAGERPLPHGLRAPRRLDRLGAARRGHRRADAAADLDHRGAGCARPPSSGSGCTAAGRRSPAGERAAEGRTAEGRAAARRRA